MSAGQALSPGEIEQPERRRENMSDDTTQSRPFLDTYDGPPVVRDANGDLCCPHCTSSSIYLGEPKADRDHQGDARLRVRFVCETCERDMDLCFVERKGATSMKWRTAAWR